MAIDFNKILTKQASAIEKPKPLPVGLYLFNNPALPKFIGVGKNETPCAEFGLVLLQPGDDVDMEALTAYGNWKGKSVRHRMFLTENSEFRTKEELCEKFGLEEGDKTLGQLFNETINKQVWAKIKHRPSEDGTEMFHEIEELVKA
jgi:hypothetical protein